jgi:hypothetical protein
VDRQAVGAEQIYEPRCRTRVGKLNDPEVRQQQRRPRGGAIRAQQRRVGKQGASRAEDEGDAVLGRGAREAAIDHLGLRRPTGHR